MRVFIAVKVPSEVAIIAKQVQYELRRKLSFAKISWPDLLSLHLTLKFIGDVNEQELDKIKGILLYETKQGSPFLFKLNGLAGFFNYARARVVGLKVLEVSETAGRMIKNLNLHLSAVKSDLDLKPWRPHLTLGRVKDGRVDLTKVKLEIPEISWKADSIELIKSELYSDGAKHEILQSFELKKQES